MMSRPWSPAATVLCAVTLTACAADAPTDISDPLSVFPLNALAAAACQPFSAMGTTYMVLPPMGPPTFQGFATVQIGSTTFEDVAVTTTLTGSVKQGEKHRDPPDLRGAQVVTTAHVFDFGAGNVFWTEDIARIIPTRTSGVSKLLSTLRIVGGTGAFAGVAANPNPRFTGDQTSTMAGPVATWSFSAHICGYGG